MIPSVLLLQRKRTWIFMTNWIRLYDLFSVSKNTAFDRFTLPHNPSPIDLFPGSESLISECGSERLKRKENSSKTIHLFSPSPSFHFFVVVVSPSSSSMSWLSRNLDLVPFRFHCCFWLSKVFNPPLRIDSPICNHCCYGTFLHFSLQVFHHKREMNLSFLLT